MVPGRVKAVGEDTEPSQQFDAQGGQNSHVLRLHAIAKRKRYADLSGDFIDAETNAGVRAKCGVIIGGRWRLQRARIPFTWAVPRGGSGRLSLTVSYTIR